MPTAKVTFCHSCVVQVLSPQWVGSKSMQVARGDSVTGIVRPHMKFGVIPASDVLCDDGRILKDVYRFLYTLEGPQDTWKQADKEIRSDVGQAGFPPPTEESIDVEYVTVARPSPKAHHCVCGKPWDSEYCPDCRAVMDYVYDDR